MKSIFFFTLILTPVVFADDLYYFQWFTEPPPELIYFSETGITKISILISFSPGYLREVIAFATPGQDTISCCLGINRGGSQIWSGLLYHLPTDPSPDYYSEHIFPSCPVWGDLWITITGLGLNYQIKSDSDGGHLAINWMYSPTTGWSEYNNDYAIRIRYESEFPDAQILPVSLGFLKSIYK